MAIKLAREEDDFAETHEINVTPFIDVILVLLIIFMVAATLATVDMGVDLPASTAEAQPRPDKPVFVTVKPDMTLGIGEDVVFHAASTMKVPVMIELFRRADAGTFAIDGITRFENRFRSIVDGSPYTLAAEDDSDGELYAKAGQPVSWRELNERMITRSSNLATNVLIDVLGADRVNATSRALGAAGMTVLRGVEDQKAFDKGMNNTTTARALGVLLEAIETGRAASAASCSAMRDVLLRQTETGEIPAGLPPGTRIAHKTGWITATTHDAAVIYPPGGKPYVLVVLTRKIPDRPVAQRPRKRTPPSRCSRSRPMASSTSIPSTNRTW